MTTKVTRDVFDGTVRPIEDIDINGGSIDGTVIGSNTPEEGFFTNLTAENLDVTSNADFENATVTNLNAYYADIAERYKSEQDYDPGTVVRIGGPYEITRTTYDGDRDVFGVISTSPAYILNSMAEGEFMLPVALLGRVPCLVRGPIYKGERLMAGENGTAVRLEGSMETCFARALETKEDTETRLIEVAIVTIK